MIYLPQITQCQAVPTCKYLLIIQQQADYRLAATQWHANVDRSVINTATSEVPNADILLLIHI